MAKELAFRYKDTDVSIVTEKVDRTKLYGFVDSEVLDEKGRRCELVTLASDGRTLLGRGDAGLAVLSSEGEWLERQTLTPVNAQGEKITPVPSSYAAPVALERTATVDEFLSHNIRATYQITLGAVGEALLAELRSGVIYTFPYSFRGGYQADVGFLIANLDGVPFLLVGEPTETQYVGLAEASGVVEEEAPQEGDATEGDIDFGMM